jgi:CRISPR-associated protein Cas5h
MEKLISIDFKGDFGFFRKPDANNTVNLSYNLLHKPALLGILGAIIGMDGYKEKGKMPEYYVKLNHIPLGIMPLKHEKGNFQKTVIKYSNTVGYANKGTTFLTEEATLIKPSYRIFVLLNTDNEDELKLYSYLQNGEAVYLPYFGKNEHYAWWDSDSFKEYEYEKANNTQDGIFVKTLFIKEIIVKEHRQESVFDMFSFIEEELPYMYFERLPKDFDETLFQYKIADCVLTTVKMKNSIGIRSLYYLPQEKAYVQLL